MDGGQASYENLLGARKDKDRRMPDPRSYRFPALLPGLIVAQAIATFQVYLSDLELHRTLETIKALGYLPVPNDLVMPSLTKLFPAFLGGLFFTLSLGAGLSLVSLAAAWAWRRFPQRKRTLLAMGSIFWTAVLIAVNGRGFNLSASFYFILIPPVVLRAALRGPASKRRLRGYGRWIPVAAAVFLAVLWLPHMDRDFFGKVRDRLLLSNRIGQRVNQFYYDHTLYAAQVLKPLDQKTITTCSLEKVKSAPVARALERALAKQDCLNRGGDGVADIQVAEAGSRFVLSHQETPMMEASLTDLLVRTGPVLKAISSKSDRQVFFRKAVYASLLIGFPVILYVFLVDLFRFGLGFFLTDKTAYPAAVLICFFLGAGLLAVFSLCAGSVRSEMQAGGPLGSENPYDRVAAMKMIEQEGLEIAGFPGYERLLSSPNAVERYWLARTLAASRRERTYRDLLNLLDDPQLNVATMAYDALGRRGDRRAVPEILKRIRASRNWYEQWYAYRALKALGWTQSRTAGAGNTPPAES